MANCTVYLKLKRPEFKRPEHIRLCFKKFDVAIKEMWFSRCFLSILNEVGVPVVGFNPPM